MQPDMLWQCITCRLIVKICTCFAGIGQTSEEQAGVGLYFKIDKMGRSSPPLSKFRRYCDGLFPSHWCIHHTLAGPKWFDLEEAGVSSHG